MIRRDIWAVKLWDHAIGDFCFAYMSYDPQLASSWARNWDDRSSTVRPKIVHPAQWVVEAFVACRNVITRRELPWLRR